MYIYNINNNNNTNFERGYKIVQRRESHLSLGRDVKDITASNSKSAKCRRLTKQNIKFLKQLGFQVNKK